MLERVYESFRTCKVFQIDIVSIRDTPRTPRLWRGLGFGPKRTFLHRSWVHGDRAARDLRSVGPEARLDARCF